MFRAFQFSYSGSNLKLASFPKSKSNESTGDQKQESKDKEHDEEQAAQQSGRQEGQQQEKHAEPEEELLSGRIACEH